MLFPILFLTFLCSLIHGDPIHFDVAIHCDSSIKFWCGDIIIYEHDTWTSHDILQQKKFCTAENAKDYKFTVSPGWDYSTHYEFAYVLHHNCTAEGMDRCLRPNEKTNVWTFGEHSIDFNIRAYENGLAKVCEGPNEN
ncbi:DUF870 domain-containing protein [Caenorhabditis elegans]|uniref:Uncharacterized protein n=1 Tax=Caenorhabditis elegans TaxID=6239 RepID=Q20532_CAEEL|nr:Uncharacterized protein CELE_F47C12.6 [Caenorhabditis elegans]CCD71381.1 Uncharacterized protein CELE_F47C12.6 [Caenorhabditis elegans]|eukprot:NP_500455.1 Uncharacterized protein CELE_F47C12.6 [Caenorhabditis elegans]